MSIVIKDMPMGRGNESTSHDRAFDNPQDFQKLRHGLSERWLIGVLLSVIGFIAGAWIIGISVGVMDNKNDTVMLKADMLGLKKQLDGIEGKVDDIHKMTKERKGL